jgi:AraC-like DNA-binding protein
MKTKINWRNATSFVFGCPQRFDSSVRQYSAPSLCLVLHSAKRRLRPTPRTTAVESNRSVTFELLFCGRFCHMPNRADKRLEKGTYQNYSTHLPLSSKRIDCCPRAIESNELTVSLMMSDISLWAGQGNASKQLIDTLRRSRLFLDYESIFTKATGLPLTLRPLEYWRLAHRGKKKENPFCAMLAEHPATLGVCLQAHANLIRETGDRPHTVTCPFGLTETAVPVKHGEKTIGYLRIGQVLRRSQQKADTENVKRTLAEHGFRFTNEVSEAWEHNVLIPPDKYDAIVRLLTFFSEQLSTLLNQIMQEKENAEPLLVRKAREYITKNRTESLSLMDVAKASGANVFYFCKVFKKTTGLRFTDYVARVRLDDAKTELLNPNRRISEIAYDVGFQSLPQFNRVFKRIFGQSPTQFRTHLSSGKRAVKVS